MIGDLSQFSLLIYRIDVVIVIDLFGKKDFIGLRTDKLRCEKEEK